MGFVSKICHGGEGGGVVSCPDYFSPSGREKCSLATRDYEKCGLGTRLGGGEKSPKVVCFDLREQTPCCCNLPPRKLFNTESGSVNKGCNVDCE